MREVIGQQLLTATEKVWKVGWQGRKTSSFVVTTMWILFFDIDTRGLQPRYSPNTLPTMVYGQVFHIITKSISFERERAEQFVGQSPGNPEFFMKIKLTPIVKNSTNINKKGCISESPYHNNDSCYLKRYTYFNNWFSKQFWTSRTWDSTEPDVFICITWNLYVNSYQIQKKIYYIAGS